MKILIFSEFFYPHVGGIEIALKEIAKGLVRKGHEVGVVARSDDLDQKKIDGVKFFEVKKPPLRYFYFFRSIKNWRIVKDYDVIHTYNSIPMLSGYLFKNIFRKPSVLTVLEVLGKSLFKYSKFTEATINYLTEFFYPGMNFNFYSPISNSTKEMLKTYGVPENKMETIYLGVDHDKFKPIPVNDKLRKKLKIEDDEKVYAFAGRTSKLKGLSSLIFAANIVKSNFKKSKLLLLVKRADPHVDEFEHVKRLVERFNLSDHVIILDENVQDNPDYLNLADILVSPSLSEGFGLSAAEASSMGKPVVATKVGSLPEIVEDKRSGFLVNPDSPTELAEKILYLLNNEKEAQKMGRNGQKYTKKFDWENTVKQYENVFKSLV